jgi:hypothetical protein
LLWEDGAFWVLTGPWARLFDHVRSNPRVTLVVDVCDIEKGLAQQEIARGDAELVPFDIREAGASSSATSVRTNPGGTHASFVTCTTPPS